MAKLLLVRHGETEWNKEGLFQGQSNIDLNEKGVKQAEMLREYLNREKIDTIYCSDLKRAITTAQIIAMGRNLNLVPCSELREMNFGSLEGRNITECLEEPANANWWNGRDPNYPPPGGESVEQLTSRVCQFIKKINLFSEETLMIVSHGGTVRSLICVLLEVDTKCWWQFQVGHTSLSIIRTTPQRGAVLSLLNNTSHLERSSE